MRTRFFAVACIAFLGATAAKADDYTIDPVHSSVTFKISHTGLSWVHGRFNEFSGEFTLDPDASKCAFSLDIKATSIDTANGQRDTHLRSPDFFNVKQFPAIGFKSTAVKATKGGFEVTGDFTMHGVTKPMTFSLVGGKTAEFPKGVHRTGYSTELVLKRSDFGIEKGTPAVGDDVHIEISFQGTMKK